MSATAIVLSILAVAIIVAAAALCWAVFSTQRIVRMADRLVPARGKFIEIDGNRIHYYEEGEGRPILLIHGLGGHYHHMRRPLMDAFGPGYRLIAIDRAGSGHSTRARGISGRLTEQARQIHRFIEALKLGPTLLVGHSLGGAVALATALDYPEDVAGLALISPLTQHIPALRPEFKALYIPSPALRRVISHTIAVPMSVRNAEKTLAFIFGPNKPPEDYAIEGGAIVGLRPSHFYATSTDMVAIPIEMPAQETRYGELKMPVGMLFGAQDRVLDPQVHGVAMQEKVQQLDFELLDGIGHMPQFAATEQTVALIRRVAERSFGQAG